MNSHDHFDQTAEDLEYAVYFEPLVVASGFNRDVIAEVVPDGDGTKNGDVVVTSYYVTDALIATAGTAANSANLADSGIGGSGSGGSQGGSRVPEMD